MSISVEDLPLIERLRIVPIAEAARLAGVSVDSLRRNHADKILKMGPRAIGMRQGDALTLTYNSRAPQITPTFAPRLRGSNSAVRRNPHER